MITLFMDDRAILALNKDLQDVAREFSKRGGMREPLERMRDEVLAPSIDKNFAVGGRPEAWEGPLPNTWYRKKYNGESDPPLWVTGKLKKAAGAKARFKIASNRMTYGYFPNSLFWAWTHDKGYPDANIPQRPFAIIQGEDIQDCVKILDQWVQKKINDHVKVFYV